MSVRGGGIVVRNFDKTGYSLTAGSYVVRASSTQHTGSSLAAVGSNTIAISSVTLARASIYQNGNDISTDDVTDSCVRSTLTSATVVTVTRGSAGGTANADVVVAEFF